MDCRRAEELLSDHYEGTLSPLERSELDSHLEDCPRCGALLEALGSVIEALHSFPLLEPGPGLAERVAAAALARPRRAAAPRPHVLPSWLQAAAAGFVLVVAGTFLLVTGPEAPTRAATRLVDRTLTAGSFLMERKDRLVEDVRILGVVIGTAFEGRLDRMNDRVNDYRQLLERRRNASEEEKKRSTGGPVSRLFAETFRTGGRRDA
jgi:anti-sigma factor RsiW